MAVFLISLLIVVLLIAICFVVVATYKKHEKKIPSKVKRTLSILAVASAGVLIIGGYLALINGATIADIVSGSIFNEVESKKINSVFVEITNKQSETISINTTNEFFLWLPGLMNAEYVEGRYEFVTDEAIEIPPVTTKRLEAKILNTNRFYDYYKSGDCDIMLWIQTDKGLFRSQNMLFSKEGLRKYYTVVVIDPEDSKE